MREQTTRAVVRAGEDKEHVCVSATELARLDQTKIRRYEDLWAYLRKQYIFRRNLESITPAAGTAPAELAGRAILAVI